MRLLSKKNNERDLRKTRTWQKEHQTFKYSGTQKESMKRFSKRQIRRYEEVVPVGNFYKRVFWTHSNHWYWWY